MTTPSQSQQTNQDWQEPLTMWQCTEDGNLLSPDAHEFQTFLKLMGRPHENFDANRMLVEFNREIEQRVLPRLDQFTTQFVEQETPEETITFTRNRILFQMRQHQFATKLMEPALQAHNNQPEKIHELMLVHQPWIERATRADAVMKSTVLAAHQELGLPTDPTSVEQRWKQINGEVDLAVTRRQVIHFRQWMNRNAEYPKTSVQMSNLWRQEQTLAAHQLIQDWFTEPIAAKALAEEDNSSLAADLL